MKNKIVSIAIVAFFTTCLFTANAQNVGIGITIPLEKLDVNGNIQVNGNAGLLHADGSANFLKFSGNNDTHLSGATWVRLRAGGSDKFVVMANQIVSSVNLGIGSGIIPTHALDVDGEVRIRTLNNDNTLDSVLVSDGSGVIHYRDKSTLGDGTGTDDQTLAEVLAQGNDANNNQIKNILDPTSAQDAVTKNYVDINLVTAGAGMTKTGTDVDIIAANASLIIGANDMNVNLGHGFNWTATHDFDALVTMDQVSINTTDGVFSVTGSNNVDVNITGAVVLDADAASRFNVTGAALTLSTTTSGDLVLNPAGNINASTNTIQNVVDPTSAQDAATKNYVDNVSQGLNDKGSCRAATTYALPACTYSNGTAGLGATLTADANGALVAIDGITMVASDCFLVKDQASALQNGLYIVTQVGDGSNPFILTRHLSNNEADEFAGAFSFIEEGSTYVDAGWVCSTDNPVTVGTTAITWVQFSSVGTITASNQGSDGVGVYDTKIGNELQFRNIASASSKISISLNSKDIDVDVVEANLTLNNLIGAPSGIVVGTTDYQTLTNKTLIFPVISSISNGGTLTLPSGAETLVGRSTTDVLTNKTLDDATTSFADNSDATKKMQFQLSGITTATTRTLTLPDTDGTMVYEDNTATLTNKTISAASNTITGLVASAISNFDTEVSNNSNVTANTVKVSADGSINTHSDVAIFAPADDDVLVYNIGQGWINASLADADISSVGHTHVAANITDFSAAADARITVQAGAANGLATLDGGGKVPATQLNLSNVDYSGTWNAFTNTPSLADGIGTQGNYYVVSVDGSTSIDGITDWRSGDWIIYNGTVWEKADHTDLVTSVAGKQGAVTIQLADITDLSTTADLPENANLYYTQARFNSAFSGKNSGDLTEGANLFYTEARVTANSSVAANTAKVSADGVITTHSDIVVTAVADNEVLAYNIGTSKWINQTADEAGLVGLTDTQTLTNKTLTAPVISSIENSGTLTLPSGAETLVGRSTTDNLTNKTLTSPVISSIENSGTLTLPSGTETLVGRSTTDVLTNKTLDDATTSFADNSDATKKMQFQLSGIATATTRTLTVPDVNGTLVTNSNVANLTNKTISATSNTITNLSAFNITDFDTEVSNNPSVTTNTIKVSADGAIETHSDVFVTFVADDEVLSYDTGTSKWINQTPAEAGLSAVGHAHTASDLTDFTSESNTLFDARLETKNTDNLPEGSNMYYTETRVVANSNVAANTAKVSADGSVTTHSDVVVTTVADNEVLAYNTATNKWVNQTPAEAGLSAGGHVHNTSDITTGTLADARVAESNVTQHVSALDHGSITGLGGDDHTQYALLFGRSGGQTIIGGTASGDNLTLESTSDVTKGSVISLDPLTAPTVTAPQVISTGVVRLQGYTVGTLPAGTMGDTAYVTDGATVTYNAPVVGGGGTVVPVFFNGTAWVYH